MESTFTEPPVSRDKEGRPDLLMHSEDAPAPGITTGDRVEIGNMRGEVVLHARLFDKIKRGVVMARLQRRHAPPRRAPAKPFRLLRPDRRPR
nr:molybdopterin dinucleotide binding domain-containing protein [Aminobacter aminovorans]